MKSGLIKEKFKRIFSSDKLKFNFESKSEKYIFAGLAILIVATGAFTFTSAFFTDNHNIGANQITGNVIKTGSTDNLYQKFKCSCCGQPIDADCCGMAKQRKEYVDKLLSEKLSEMEINVEMVKKFGFDILMNSADETKIKEYLEQQSPKNPAVINIEPKSKDLGTISQKDGKISTLFTITNYGNGDLIIENIDTSCMCTSARINYDGQNGPIFGMSMHGENPENYRLIIPAGESALLEVFYDPLAHGLQKDAEQKIIREVTIISNDPVNFQKKVRIELTQTP